MGSHQNNPTASIRAIPFRTASPPGLRIGTCTARRTWRTTTPQLRRQSPTRRTWDSGRVPAQHGGPGGPPLHNFVDRVQPVAPGTQEGYLHSTEDLEDHHSTTSSTESNPSHLGLRKDHEFIPTRMKTISASKPAADPSQFTRVNSNPLLISAQKQLMKVEEVKKKAQAQKEVIRKVGGDDQPDWQDNLSSWKDRRRKQSEEALMRVAEVKALDDQGDDPNQQK